MVTIKVRATKKDKITIYEGFLHGCRVIFATSKKEFTKKLKEFEGCPEEITQFLAARKKWK